MQDAIDVELYYPYGYQGRTMIAVRAPFAMTGDGAGLVGKPVRAGGLIYEVVAISRQITGPIAAGEPIGLEVRAVSSQADA